jgi:hypothetical protein
LQGRDTEFARWMPVAGVVPLPQSASADAVSVAMTVPADVCLV